LDGGCQVLYGVVGVGHPGTIADITASNGIVVPISSGVVLKQKRRCGLGWAELIRATSTTNLIKTVTSDPFTHDISSLGNISFVRHEVAQSRGARSARGMRVCYSLAVLTLAASPPQSWLTDRRIALEIGKTPAIQLPRFGLQFEN
jgi:hypothetical protein